MVDGEAKFTVADIKEMSAHFTDKAEREKNPDLARFYRERSQLLDLTVIRSGHLDFMSKNLQKTRDRLSQAVKSGKVDEAGAKPFFEELDELEKAISVGRTDDITKAVRLAREEPSWIMKK